jgi:uncharacterized protein YodC (DUF2158 family)
VAFNIGDLVELKSGGPKMTVTRVDDLGIRTIVRCTWFADSKKEQGEFPPEALVSSPPVVKKKVNVTRGDRGTSE